MSDHDPSPPASVIGPLGEPLTLETLPPPGTCRWVIRRKAEVVAAVNGGLLGLDEACRRYSLTAEEFATWQKALAGSGLQGLRATRLQHYRNRKSGSCSAEPGSRADRCGGEATGLTAPVHCEQ